MLRQLIQPAATHAMWERPMWGLLAVVTLAVVTLASWFSVPCWGAELVLREQATATSSIIRLGDLAEVHAVDADEAARLAQTPLWVAPPAGEQRYVTARQIEDVLVSRGIVVDDLHFAGSNWVALGEASPTSSPHRPQLPVTSRQSERVARQVVPVAATEGVTATTARTGFRIRRSTVPVASRPATIFLTKVQREALTDQVREAALQYLHSQLEQDVALEIDLALSTGQLDLLALQTSEVTVSGGRLPWTGRQALVLEFESEQGPQRLGVQATVFDTTPIVMVRHPLARGQLITAADLLLESPGSDLSLPPGQPLVYSVQEALGKEARRPLREGEPLLAADCLAPQMVTRGEIVSVISASGGIRITRQAKATSPARQGELTEVELLDRRERLVARVIGPGQLALLNGGLSSRSP